MLLAAGANSAPQIDSAVLEDGYITITGKNFGNGNPMLFWDNVLDSYNQDHLVSENIVPTSETHKWKNNTNSYGKPFRFAEKTDGKSRKPTVYYEATAKSTFLMEPNHPQPESLRNRMFISWWYKPSVDPSRDGGSNKFIRVWDNHNGYGTRISWTQMHMTCSDKVTWGTWRGMVGEWNHHMMDIDLERKSTRAWLNGELLHEIACEKDKNYLNVPLHIRSIGFEHNWTLFQDMTTGIADIYIGSGPARVEISESPQWRSVMKKEILPIQRWEDGRITTMVHDGIVPIHTGTFLYVIDKNEKVNEQGIPIDCKSCPKTPESL